MHSIETEILIIMAGGLSAFGIFAIIDSVAERDERLVNRLFTGFFGAFLMTLFPLLLLFLFKSGYVKYSLLLR
jgi:hypothetical protein